MPIRYTVLAGERWMTHGASRLSYEKTCDGCGDEFDGRYVLVITDRSGSEYAAVHDERDDCVAAAVKRLERE